MKWFGCKWLLFCLGSALMFCPFLIWGDSGLLLVEAGLFVQYHACMVVLTETVCCPACSSSAVVRFGKTGAGDQRYRCQTCRRVFGLHPNRRSHPEALKQQVINAYQERASMRGVCRLFGISRNTLIKWLGEKNTDASSA